MTSLPRSTSSTWFATPEPATGDWVEDLRRFARAHRCRGFRGFAAFGYDALAHQTYYGLRLHLLVAWPGASAAMTVGPLSDSVVGDACGCTEAHTSTAPVTAATPKLAAQAIRRVFDLAWRPLHYLSYVASSIAAVMEPAGAARCIDIFTAIFVKDSTDPAWAKRPEP